MIFCKKNILLLLAVGFAFTANNAIATNSVRKVKKVKQNFISNIALYEPAVQNSIKYAFQINGQPEQGIAKQLDVSAFKSIYGLAIGRSSPVKAIAAYNVGDSLPKNSIVAECQNYDSAMALKEVSNVSNSNCNAKVAYQYAIQSSIAAYHNSDVFSLDNVAYKMAFDQKNGLIQPAVETRPYIDSSSNTAIFSLDLARPHICFYSLADRCVSYANAFEYAVPDCIFGGCSVLPVDGVKNSIVSLANGVSGIAYSEAFDAGISYLNFISKLDNKCQQPTIDKKAILRSFYGISDLDMIGMTRNDDSSWLSIPAQCRFRALQKIQNGEDPSEEFMVAALWQQREEDQALALETNKYVVSMSAIVNMRSVSAKSIVVVGFYNALDQIKVIVAATQLDGKQLEIDEDLASLAIERLKQKNLMTNTVKARVYSHVMQTTFTFEVVKQP